MILLQVWCLFSQPFPTSTDKQTIACVLEIAIHVTVLDILNPNDGTGETNVFGIRIVYAPLSQKITGITSLLTGSDKEDGRSQKEEGGEHLLSVFKVICHDIQS